jgi:hypothetical protein
VDRVVIKNSVQSDHLFGVMWLAIVVIVIKYSFFVINVNLSPSAFKNYVFGFAYVYRHLVRPEPGRYFF